jgi:isopenicillin N synthase-like dioxygenase
MDLGKTVVSVGQLLAFHCDKYVGKRIPDFAVRGHKLEDIIKTSRCAKARLLHYFPQDESAVKAPPAKADDDNVSSWCGWHNDHGSLTGLTSAMYLDSNGNMVGNPDPKSGLYVKKRNGKTVKVNLPADHLGFQIGETSQVHAGGVLKATPHAVRGAEGPAAKGIARSTFAVFMEPEWSYAMDLPNGVTPSEMLEGTAAKFMPPGVPPLGSRWVQGDDFGTFSNKTFALYY